MHEKENPLKIIARRIVIFTNFMVSGIKLTVSGSYWHNFIISKVLLLSCLANLSIWVYLFIRRINSSSPVILHYNLFFGVDSLGDYNKLFLLPLIGLFFLFLNSFLGYFFYKVERLASYLLTINILIVQIFLLLSGYLIIKANV